MIGIFDSGSGGLTVLKAMRDELPSCDVVYFGDIAHVPYGSKSQDELLALVVHGIQFLHERGANKIVSACNSVSASMALSLLDVAGIDTMIEMVGPTVSYFKDTSYRIALCATPATVRSGIYQSAFSLIGKTIEAIPIPDLAPAIEFGAPADEVSRVIGEALSSVDMTQFDVLILACTHYPLVVEQFKKLVPESVVLFDPALAVAERVYQKFWPQEVGNGQTTFIINKDSEQFRDLVVKLFPDTKYTVEVVE